MPEIKQNVGQQFSPAEMSASRGPRLYTEREVADMTGLSVCTLRKWRFERRHLPYIKIGSAVRYADTDIIALWQTHKITPEI